MQGWMIALIVVAAVVLFLALALLIGSLVAVKVVLGRHKPGKIPTKNAEEAGDSADLYGIDITWFGRDEIKAGTDQLEITSYDGIKLRAIYIKHAEPTMRVGLLHHGFTATPRSMQAQAKMLFDKGFDVVMPAARAHDISDGKYSGMGWLDRFDSLRWMDKIVDLYGKKVEIALVGVSMGGATSIAAAGMEPPPQLKCVVDDCGFSSQRDEYYACIDHIKLPNYLCVLPLDIGVRLKCGYSIYDADIVSFAKKMTVPALFIHGSEDKFVPAELGRKMYEACASEHKELYIAEGARHAASYVVNKEKYAEVFNAFIDKYCPSAEPVAAE